MSCANSEDLSSVFKANEKSQLAMLIRYPHTERVSEKTWQDIH